MGILPSIGITLFVLLGVIMGALFGLLRGFKRSIITLIGTIASAVIAFFATLPLSSWGVNFVMTSIDMSSIIPDYEMIMEASPALKEFIEILPSVVIAPIVFILLFIVIKLIMKIPCGILSLSMGNKSYRRIFGLPIGAVQGLVSAMVFVFVLTGLISTADNIAGVFLNDETESTEEVRETLGEIDVYVESVKSDPVVGMLCGEQKDSKSRTSVNFVFNGLTSFNFRGEKVSLNDELVNVTDIVVSVFPVVTNSDFATWSDKEIEAVENFADSLKESVVITHLGADLLSQMSQKWSENEPFMGMEPPTTNETIDPLMHALFVSLKETNVETIKVDISTVVEIFKVMHRHGVLAKFSGEVEANDLIATLSGDFISDIMSVLSSNERFSILVPEVANLGLRLLATTLNLPANNQEIYQSVITELSESLNKALSEGVTEEDAILFADEMMDILKSNGISVSKEASDIVANAIVESFENKEVVTPTEIQDFFQNLAVVYDSIEIPDSEQTQGNNGVVNLSGNKGNGTSVDYRNVDIKTLNYSEKCELLAEFGVYDHYSSNYDLSNPNNILSNGMTSQEFVDYIIKISVAVGSNHEKISAMGDSANNPMLSLSSPETMITTKVTTNDLLLSSDMTLSSDDIKQLGESFESISKFIDSYSNIEGDLSLENLKDLDLASAGKALDGLRNISAFSNSVDKLSTAVISSVAGTNVDISQKLNDGSTNFEELFTTVQSTAQVVSNISKEGLTEEEKEEAILDLLLNLTPGTAEIVNEIITIDLIIEQGVPVESAEASVKALRVAFTEMAGLPESEHDKEAQFIMRMFELSTYVKSSVSQDSIIGENGLFKSEEELVDMAIHSKVAAAALKAITVDEKGDPIYDAFKVADDLNDTNKRNITGYLEKIYNESKGTMSASDINDLESKIIAVSHLLNVEITFIK